MKEIYEDVLKKEPQLTRIKGKLFYDSKEQNEFTKRLRKSIGWVEPNVEYYCACDEGGKTWKGAEIKKKQVWEVSLGDGSGFTCERQIEAELLSYLAQINERLKRIEKKEN